jgi:hypothetical protein
MFCKLHEDSRFGGLILPNVPVLFDICLMGETFLIGCLFGLDSGGDETAILFGVLIFRGGEI